MNLLVYNTDYVGWFNNDSDDEIENDTKTKKERCIFIVEPEQVDKDRKSMRSSKFPWKFWKIRKIDNAESRFNFAMPSQQRSDISVVREKLLKTDKSHLILSKYHFDWKFWKKKCRKEIRMKKIGRKGRNTVNLERKLVGNLEPNIIFEENKSAGGDVVRNIYPRYSSNGDCIYDSIADNEVQIISESENRVNNLQKSRKESQSGYYESKSRTLLKPQGGHRIIVASMHDAKVNSDSAENVSIFPDESDDSDYFDLFLPPEHLRIISEDEIRKETNKKKALLQHDEAFIREADVKDLVLSKHGKVLKYSRFDRKTTVVWDTPSSASRPDVHRVIKAYKVKKVEKKPKPSSKERLSRPSLGFFAPEPSAESRNDPPPNQEPEKKVEPEPEPEKKEEPKPEPKEKEPTSRTCCCEEPKSKKRKPRSRCVLPRNRSSDTVTLYFPSDTGVHIEVPRQIVLESLSKTEQRRYEEPCKDKEKVIKNQEEGSESMEEVTKSQEEGKRTNKESKASVRVRSEPRSGCVFVIKKALGCFMTCDKVPDRNLDCCDDQARTKKCKENYELAPDHKSKKKPVIHVVIRKPNRPCFPCCCYGIRRRRVPRKKVCRRCKGVVPNYDYTFDVRKTGSCYPCRCYVFRKRPKCCNCQDPDCGDKPREKEQNTASPDPNENPPPDIKNQDVQEPKTTSPLPDPNENPPPDIQNQIVQEPNTSSPRRKNARFKDDPIEKQPPGTKTKNVKEPKKAKKNARFDDNPVSYSVSITYDCLDSKASTSSGTQCNVGCTNNEKSEIVAHRKQNDSKRSTSNQKLFTD